MKEPNQNTDPQLKEVLQTWGVNEPLPPRFQERVWKRIEAAETPKPETTSWFAALFLRPAFATAAAMLLLIAGLSAGYLRANHDAAHWNHELSQRYVVALNPYAGGHP